METKHTFCFDRLVPIADVAASLGITLRRAHAIVAQGQLTAALVTPLGRLYALGDVEALATRRQARRDGGDHRIVV
jgi:hypothetical protein